MNKLAYNVKEAAKTLGLRPSSIYNYCASGNLPCVRVGNRIVIPKQALVEMLESAGKQNPASKA